MPYALAGGRLFRADFRVVGTRVLVEFDGAVKYADGRRATLFEEKRREDALRREGWVRSASSGPTSTTPSGCGASCSTPLRGLPDAAGAAIRGTDSSGPRSPCQEVQPVRGGGGAGG
jgi:hypothetical protein